MPLSKQLCVPAEWRSPIMVGYHDNLNHSNAAKAYYSIRQRYFWKNQYANIENFVKSCEVSQKIRNQKWRYIKLSQVPNYESFSCLHAHHCSEVNPASENKYHFVLVLTDHRTQLVELISVCTTGAQETARCIYEKYLLRYCFIPILFRITRNHSWLNSRKNFSKYVTLKGCKQPAFIRRWTAHQNSTIKFDLIPYDGKNKLGELPVSHRIRSQRVPDSMFGS